MGEVEAHGFRPQGECLVCRGHTVFEFGQLVTEVAGTVVAARSGDESAPSHLHSDRGGWHRRPPSLKVSSKRSVLPGNGKAHRAATARSAELSGAASG